LRAFGITFYDALVGANVPPDKASALVPAMERQMFEPLATQQDLQALQSTIAQQLLALEPGLKEDLTVRLGTLLAASIGLIVPLLKAF
jgi:phosphopantothenoylcysteine synthetase/decarboxylase